MKKKILIAAITSALILAISGCSKNDDSTTNTTSTTASELQSTTEAELSTEASTEAQEKSLKGLSEYLLEQGVVSGTTEEPLYQYIGAIGGFKYLDSNVEVYEFDTTSDTYSSILSTNEVSGLTVSAINGPYVLIFSTGSTVNQSVIDAFNNY